MNARINRLKGRSLIRDVFRKGCRAQGRCLKIFFDCGGEARFGISSPKYAGNAVQRNRVKRIMREVYRHNRSMFPDGGSILYVIKKCAERDEIEPEMITLSSRVQESAQLKRTSQAQSTLPKKIDEETECSPGS